MICLDECSYCRQKSEDLKKCSKCRLVAYCCRKHQIRGWKEGHKQVCDELAKNKLASNHRAKEKYRDFIRSLPEHDIASSTEKVL